jgi:hypothetical protein
MVHERVDTLQHASDVSLLCKTAMGVQLMENRYFGNVVHILQSPFRISDLATVTYQRTSGCTSYGATQEETHGTCLCTTMDQWYP